MRYLLLLYTLVLVYARPVEEEPYTHEHESVAELHRQLNLVTYVENFKQILSEYVTKTYNHLTINEIKKVKIILEDFLKSFTNDLKDILNGNKVDNIDLNKKIEDGIPDDHFDVIKEKVKEEFKDVNNETVDKIVYTLRKDLFMTRRLLDYVIEESKRTLEANSH